jgi:hypothetical protein
MRAVAQPKPAVAVSAWDVVGKQLGAAGGSVDQSLVKQSSTSPTSARDSGRNTSPERIHEGCAGPRSTGSTTIVRTSERCTTTRSLPQQSPVPRQTRRSGEYCPGPGGSKLRHSRLRPLSASNSHGRKCSGSLRLRTQPSRQQMEQRCTDSRRAMPQSRTQAAAPARHTVHSTHRISSRRRWLELASPTRFALNPDVAHVIEHGYRPSNNT